MSVLLDVELMKRAAFIFGSMTSNYYWLAAELNFYVHDDQLKRFVEVDGVAWGKTMG